MKKSFTLIEVLIATMIVFAAVAAVIGSSSNIKHMISNLISSEDFKLKSSVALLEQKNVKNLYEQMTDFNITDDDIIRNLKSEKVYLEMDSNESENNITVKSLKAYNKYYSNTVYEIGLQ